MTILQTKNLIKHFDGVRAVNDLSIGIEKRKITGIVGPNGSGKTTLINLLSGMLPADGGAVFVDGVALQSYSNILKNVGIKKMRPVRAEEVAAYGITRTFQNIRLFEQMTVLDNILVVLTERSVFSALFEKHGEYHIKKAQEVLERVGLWEKRHQLAVNLSYGQRKLLEIGRALAMSLSNGLTAEIYLFDEPFAGLFPEMVKIISGVLRELRSEGKTVILIEHDMGLIRNLCDRVFVMDSGKLLAEGKPHEVLEKREVVEAYLGE